MRLAKSANRERERYISGTKTNRSVVAAIAFFGLTGATLAEHGDTWNGKTYCFGDQKAEVVFFQKGPDEMISKAEAYYKEIHKDAKN